MKRKRADIASFLNKKKPAEAQENERQGQMEKGQTDRESEGEESPVRPGPSGPPGIQTLPHTPGYSVTFIDIVH